MATKKTDKEILKEELEMAQGFLVSLFSDTSEEFIAHGTPCKGGLVPRREWMRPFRYMCDKGLMDYRGTLTEEGRRLAHEHGEYTLHSMAMQNMVGMATQNMVGKMADGKKEEDRQEDS